MPETPLEPLVDLQQKKFNLTEAVEKFVLAQVIFNHFKSTNNPDAGYFLGIIQGYADWFTLLGIPTPIVEKVAASLDQEKINKRANEICGISENKIVPPNALSGRDMLMVSALKRAFDTKIMGRD